jgi:hypothetical protein
MPPEDVTKDNEETVRISSFLTNQKGDLVKINTFAIDSKLAIWCVLHT